MSNTDPKHSMFDPERETVGKIYRDLQINGPKGTVENGDLTNEIMSSLVEDLNETIQSNPFNGAPFYIQVVEKKDLVMPRAIHRVIRCYKWRPWPEDDTMVFWVDPQTNMIRFCWCLPHQTEMANMLNNPDLFDKTMLQQIRDWINFEMHSFGFRKDAMGNWEANPNFQDPIMQNPHTKAYSVIVPDKFIRNLD